MFVCVCGGGGGGGGGVVRSRIHVLGGREAYVLYGSHDDVLHLLFHRHDGLDIGWGGGGGGGGEGRKRERGSGGP